MVLMLFSPPWQSFEEPRCDLWENLLRYGCREGSIVYIRSEMQAQQVGAGDTALAQLLLRGPTVPSVLRVLHPPLQTLAGKIESPDLCLCRVCSKTMLCFR